MIGPIPPVLAAMAGAALALAFVAPAAWLAVFFAVGAFTLSVEWSMSTRRAIACAALFGWFSYVGGYHWVQPALTLFWGGREGLSWVVWLLGAGAVSLRFVLIAWGYRALRDRGVEIFASLMLPWLTVEWLYPDLFPFYLGNTLVDQTSLAQGASLGGPLLLSAWVCGVSAILVEAVLWLVRKRPVTPTAWSVVVGAAVALLVHGRYTLQSIEGHDEGAPSMRVGVVQANVDVMEKRGERALSHRRYAEQTEELEGRDRVDLVIWPETAYLVALPHALPTSGAAIRRGLRAPLLFGGIRARTRDGRQERFNSALMVHTDGEIRAAYDKRFLIPFAEFVPWSDELGTAWSRIAPTMSRFHRGEGWVALQLGDWRIATPICYETIRPNYVRKLVRRTGANLLVSLTNDGWFGDSAEPRLHLRLARLRAIETRRYLVRATNTGISAIVDPAGRILTRSGIFEPATLVAPVHMWSSATLYTVVGDWPGYLAVVALIALVWVRRRQTVP